MQERTIWKARRFAFKLLRSCIAVLVMLGASLGFMVSEARAEDYASCVSVDASQFELTGSLPDGPQVADPVTMSDEGNVSARLSRASAGVLPVPIEKVYAQSSARSMLNMINSLRSSLGVHSLQWSEELEGVAMQRAAELTFCFDHTRPDGTSCSTAFPSNAGTIGENIAAGQTSASAAFDAWCSSSGHYKNMVSSDFTSIGIACVYDGATGLYYWVQCFSSASGAGMVSGALDGAAYTTIMIPDSFIQAVSYDSETQYIGLNNEVSLPEVVVDIWGMFVDGRGIEGTLGYYPSFFSWQSSTAGILDLTQDASGAPCVLGLQQGSTTLSGTAITSPRLTVSIPVEVGPVRRLSGDIRYDTMASIVQEGFTSSEWAIVASGDAWPDSLAASGLAGSYDAPVVLTSKSELSPQAASELERLDVSHVLVIGGEAAVSSRTFNQIAEIVGVGNVMRVEGADRVVTSIAMADRIFEHDGAGASKTVILASSSGFADGLSSSPYAYATSSPVILVDPSGLSAGALGLMNAKGVNRVIIMGGESAVPVSVEQQLVSNGITDITRCSGATRYETSLAFADLALAQGVLNAENMIWASGENFPDALAGGALAGSKGSVLVLTDGKDTQSESVRYAEGKGVRQGYVLGGEAAVANRVMGTIAHSI